MPGHFSSPHPPPRAQETPTTAVGGTTSPPRDDPRGGHVQWEGPKTLPVPSHSGIGPPHNVRGAPGHAILQISPGAHPGPPAGDNPADGKPTVGWGGVWAKALTHSPKVLRRHPPQKVEPPPAPF